MLHLRHRLQATCGYAAMAACFWCVATVISIQSAGAQSAPDADAPAQAEPGWKTSPYHGVIGGNGNVIPCRCLFQGAEYRVGEKVCMNTYKGTVMTMCDLQLNNTSWVPTAEPCTVSTVS